MEENKRLWRRILGDKAAMVYSIGVVAVAVVVFVLLAVKYGRGIEQSDAVSPSATAGGVYYAVDQMLPSEVVFMERLGNGCPDLIVAETDGGDSTESAYLLDDGSELRLYLVSRRVSGFAYITPLPSEALAEPAQGPLGSQFEPAESAGYDISAEQSRICAVTAALCDALDVSNILTLTDITAVEHDMADFFVGDDTERTEKYGDYELTLMILTDDGADILFISFTVEF